MKRLQTFACRAASAGLGLWLWLWLWLTLTPPAVAAEPVAVLNSNSADGAILLMRHALAPGGGDPPGFVLGDCGTQRNLSDAGRTQARQIGQALRERGVRIGAVWHSQWCRTRDTAELAFPGLGRPEPAFNSFFDRPEQQAAATAQARRLLAGWRGPGLLVVVTHQVNITALSGVWPASGEGVVMKPDASGALGVVGRLPAPPP